jgi:hypothetical protein
MCVVHKNIQIIDDYWVRFILHKTKHYSPFALSILLLQMLLRLQIFFYRTNLFLSKYLMRCVSVRYNNYYNLTLY